MKGATTDLMRVTMEFEAFTLVIYPRWGRVVYMQNRGCQVEAYTLDQFAAVVEAVAKQRKK